MKLDQDQIDKLEQLDKSLADSVGHAHEVMGKINGCDVCPLRLKCQARISIRQHPRIRLFFLCVDLVSRFVTVVVLGLLLIALIT